VIYQSNGTTWDVYASTGVATLAALTDVDLTGLVDGDMIVWDTTTSKWIVAVPSGGGGFTDPLTTKGDLITRTSTTTGRKGVGANGTVLAADSAQADGVDWKALAVADVSGAAPLASPALTGNPTAPTPTAADNDTSIATTAFVQGEIAAKAPLASPTFTGDPKAPTPTAGDNDTSIATTAFVAAALAKQAEVFVFALGDETTAISVGTAKLTWRCPFPFTVTAVRASLVVASSVGIPTVDINESGTSILSTKLTIDATETTSVTAATPAVISDTSLADDAEITFDIDVAGTGAKGLKVAIYGTRT
jgi:hypothetical protein